MVVMKHVASDQIADGAARQHIAGKMLAPAYSLEGRGCCQSVYGQLDLPGWVFIRNYVSERKCCRRVSRGKESPPA